MELGRPICRPKWLPAFFRILKNETRDRIHHWCRCKTGTQPFRGLIDNRGKPSLEIDLSEPSLPASTRPVRPGAPVHTSKPLQTGRSTQIFPPPTLHDSQCKRARCLTATTVSHRVESSPCGASWLGFGGFPR